jgi:hypothetical protein
MGVFLIAMSGLNVQTLLSIMMHTVIRVGISTGCRMGRLMKVEYV